MKLGGRLLVALFAAVVVLPLVWIMLSALKSNQQILESPWIMPIPPRFDNFGKALAEQDLGRAMILSLLATAATMAFLMPIGSAAAYALARFKFWGSQALFGLLTAGLLFPNLLAAVPLVMLLAQSGWDDTLAGLVAAYVAYSLAFTIFVMHGFFGALPEELAEAAEMDGASDARVFWSVMLPLARPGLLVVALFNIIGLWNEYNLAKVILVREKTLPVGLADLISQQQYAGEWGALYAGAVLVMFPVLVVYWLLKERIQQAMLAGAIK